MARILVTEQLADAGLAQLRSAGHEGTYLLYSFEAFRVAALS